MVPARDRASRPWLGPLPQPQAHILGRSLRPSRRGGNVAAKELEGQETPPDLNTLEESFHSCPPGAVRDERGKEAEALERSVLESGLLHRLKDDRRAHVENALVAAPAHARDEEHLDVVEGIERV